MYPTTALMAAALVGQGRVSMSSPLSEAKNDSGGVSVARRRTGVKMAAVPLVTPVLLGAVEAVIQAGAGVRSSWGRSLLPSSTRVSFFRSPSDPRAACRFRRGEGGGWRGRGDR